MAAKETKKKKSAKKTMATKKPNALSFCRTYLRRSPKATFAQIRDAAAKKRIKLYPISFGRALALEGLVKSKPRKDKKKAAAKKRGPGRPKGSKNKPKKAVGRPKGSKNKRRPGRPRKTVGFGSLDNLASAIKGLQQERDQALKALGKIRDLVDSLT